MVPFTASPLRRLVACSVLLSSSLVGVAHAQSLGPDFARHYAILDLGTIPGVPTAYGGLAFDPADPSRLLLGGSANSPSAQLYALNVTREPLGGVIGVGCVAPLALYAVPGVLGGIDGGLDFGPGGVIFYTTYSDNHLGQILPGSSGPDRLIDLSALGVAPSTGTLRFVPPGFAGAGRLKIASYNTSRWYDATVAPARDGTYDVLLAGDPIQLAGGPEGIVYIAAGNPGFAADSVLVSMYASGQVLAYEIDGNGDPIPGTARVFISGLAGAEGAAIDPLTGDFFFSTFGGASRVLRVSGFTLIDPCPADLDGSRVVNGADLGALLSVWGTDGGGLADLNGDCVVDGADLGLLLGSWGPCGS